MFQKNGIKNSVLLVFTFLLVVACSEKKKVQTSENSEAPIAAKRSKLAKLAPTPPMGWNSWNTFGKQNINEAVVKETIDAMVSSGLRDAGYNYVIVDGGWRDTILGPKGELLIHKTKFPNGIKPLADYAHSKGMKFGLHVVPGRLDCGGDAVGGFNNEETHVKQFVEWDLDFIKLDLCRFGGEECTNCTPYRNTWSEETMKSVYQKWQGLFRKLWQRYYL